MKRWNVFLIITLFALNGLAAQPVYSQPGQSRLSVAASDTTNPSAGQPSGLDHAIYLRGITLQPDTQKGKEATQPQVPAPLAQTNATQEGLRIVQFRGPIQPAWLEDLRSSGLEIVAYLPNNAYLVWGNQPDSSLNQLSARQPAVRWHGPYHPLYRLAPALRASASQMSTNVSEEVDVTIQFFNTEHLQASLERLMGQARAVYQPPHALLNFTNVRVRLASANLDTIAGWPDVINIEPYQPPHMRDEIQGQILAGNLQTVGGNSVPSGPGYLAWLASKGFPTNPDAYPLVDVVDDGIDAGNADAIQHPDFYGLGDKANADRVIYLTNCTGDMTGASGGGHGNLNAGIAVGYNQQNGFPFQDSNGYQFGLGISPYGPVAGTKIFTNSGVYDASHCGDSYTQIVSSAYAAGARITSNSWGSRTSGAYTTDAQEYDILTRDASPAAGNQEMLHIFAAGNDGRSGAKSIDTPGTAKNVLTVGATENLRDNGVADGCGISSANNADDIADFSGRGPTADGRAKPDLMAPGVHVAGPASQTAEFTGRNVCKAPSSKYYPDGQTLYTWSSGTSHSTPAISGAAQLVSNYYQRVLVPGAVPSPAMLKALLLNSPRYLTGYSASGNLPSFSQGWGEANLGQLFEDTPRILTDQSQLFTASANQYDQIGKISDSSKPFRVTLVWTDAPSSPTASINLVNDLNLEVTINGKTYLGNQFSGAFSVPTQNLAADHKNNVESVFLPQGTQGLFHVRVIAHNLAGDGVPQNASPTDQDFALVISNADPSTPYLAVKQANWKEVQGNQDGMIDPGEVYAVQVALKNIGNLDAYAITAQLTNTSPNIAILQGTSSYADIAPGATQSSPIDFLVKIAPGWPCGESIQLLLDLTYNGLPDRLALPARLVGQLVPHASSASGLPVKIPDYSGASDSAGQVDVPVMVADHFPIFGLDVSVNIDHTWDSDLVIRLISPTGREVILSNQRGDLGDHYHDTIFDDQASQPIATGNPPFQGRYQPEQPLSAFSQQDASGEWKLRVQDVSAGDTGQVNQVTLNFVETRCTLRKWIPFLSKADDSLEIP